MVWTGQRPARCPVEDCAPSADLTCYPLGPEMTPEVAAYFASPAKSLQDVIGAVTFQKTLLLDQTKFLKRKCRTQQDTIRSLRAELAHAQADQRQLADLQQENAQLKAELDRRGTPSLRLQDLPPTRNDGSSERGYISTAHGTKRRAVDGLTASTATLDHPDAHKPLIRPQLGTSARLLTPSRLTIPPGTGQHGPPGSSVSSHQRPLSAKEHIAQFAYDPTRSRRVKDDDRDPHTACAPPPPPSHAQSHRTTTSSRPRPLQPAPAPLLNQYYVPPDPQLPPPPSTGAARRNPLVLRPHAHAPSQRSHFRPAAMPMPPPSTSTRVRPLGTAMTVGKSQTGVGFRAASSLGR